MVRELTSSEKNGLLLLKRIADRRQHQKGGGITVESCLLKQDSYSKEKKKINCNEWMKEILFIKNIERFKKGNRDTKHLITYQ